MKQLPLIFELAECNAQEHHENKVVKCEELKVVLEERLTSAVVLPFRMKSLPRDNASDTSFDSLVDSVRLFM